jgi:hypothetical protein
MQLEAFPGAVEDASAYNQGKRLLIVRPYEVIVMGWRGSFSNRVLPSGAVSNEYSIKTYPHSWHCRILKGLYLLPVTHRQGTACLAQLTDARPYK